MNSGKHITRQLDTSRTSAYNNITGLTEPFLPDRPYVSLFDPSVEVPRFNFSLSHWEREVEPILWGFDAKAIQRLVRYDIFNQGVLIRNIQHNRNKDTVKGFLWDIVTPQERTFTSGLTQDELVEEIIRRSRANARYFTWEWFPLQDLRTLPQR